MAEKTIRTVEILLVTDNPTEVRRLQEFLHAVVLPTTLHAVDRGEVALAFLRHEGEYTQAPLPDVSVLDLHLPGREGFRLLAELKSDPALRAILVVSFRRAEYQKEQRIATAPVTGDLTQSPAPAQRGEFRERLQRERRGMVTEVTTICDSAAELVVSPN